MQPSQSTHRNVFVDILQEDIGQRASDENLPFHTAATRILLQWLGYELDDENFIDGQDRGVDAWLATESGFEIFQIKTHDLSPDGTLDVSPFDGQGVRDLEHAKTFLLHEQPANVKNKKLKELLYQRDSAVRSHKLREELTEMSLTFHLVILGDGLTEQGCAEFKAFQQSNLSPLLLDGVPIQLRAVQHVLQEIVDVRWREEHRDWTDNRGQKHERISLGLVNEDSITDNKSAVFYCLAIDLVNAYEALGYQLFEPNVRANIKNSRVNQAIRESISHQRTRREFRFLNNGVTITCDSFTKPSRQQQHISVLHPGIVNGLQTVVALYEGYHQLTADADKEDFAKNCSVLVRLLMNNAVDDITRVVKATNNQNPMKPRNLVSNSLEQLTYARLFAVELGWFYEAKEGAWDAFEKDSKRWRPLLGKQPKDFGATNRSKIRRLDNADLAQTWLSFIGFAQEALDHKQELFDDRLYQLIFTRRTRQHGVDYNSVLQSARDEAEKQSPDPSLMLVSYLAHAFAKEMTPSNSQNRQDAYDRLKITPGNMAKEELDARLSQDDTFLLNQALGSMSLLFTEFVGFTCYRAFGDQIHRSGRKILVNHSFDILTKHFATETVKEQVKSETSPPQDILGVLWHIFVEEIIRDMLISGWGESYRAAPIKLKFVYSKETRERLYREIRSHNEYIKKVGLKRPWATGITEGQGLFEFVKRSILQ